MAESADSDRSFAGSIPALYDQYMVPLIFEVYAVDLVERIGALQPSSVLEIACGTGAVTRQMAAHLSTTVEIIATDLNQPMLDYAASRGTARPVSWRVADAMSLPFDDESVDVVACQFGAMFFPDRSRAFAEMRRVLRPGGTMVFNVWDRIETNDLVHTVAEVLAECFPDDPPTFASRVPHGYHDGDLIRSDLAAGGFSAPVSIDLVAARSRAASCHDAAIGYCKGTPLRNEIEARDPGRLDEVTAAAASAIAARFGATDLDTAISAHVVTVART